MTTTEKRILDLLQAKLKQDPEGFREYLPAVADLLPAQAQKQPSKSSSSLTQKEFDFHRAGLQKTLGKLDSGEAVRQEAIKGLEHCANLIRNDSFTTEVTAETVKRLFKAAFGKLPSSYKAKTTIRLDRKGAGPVRDRVTELGGVHLELDKNRRLVSVSVDPGQLREMREMMKIVGMIKDAPPDLAERHDDYMAMIDPHGRD